MLYDSVIDIFGKYAPIDVVSGSAVSGVGSIAFVDYSYIFMMVFVAICLVGLFKILGGVLYGRSHRI